MTGRAAAGGVTRLRVGCAMWANRAWVGTCFPAGLSSDGVLAAYTTWCTTVEGNTTFHAIPSPATVRRWADASPADFRFCFKLPRHITHERRLADVGEEVEAFVALLAPLGPRVGPLQIQLPASFGPDGLGRLDEVLTRRDRRHEWAVEVRHRDFFAGGPAERPLDDLLAAHGVNRVILDSRALFDTPPETPAEHDAWNAKPRVPVRPVATAGHPLVRLIGHRDPDAAVARWEPWFDKLASWVRAGLEPHVFTHTPDNAVAPLLARRVWAEVARRVPDLEPLPVPQRPAQQPGLF